jgi:hypothetical protein
MLILAYIRAYILDNGRRHVLSNRQGIAHISKEE